MSRNPRFDALEKEYSLPKWIKAFEEAVPAERSAVAENWLRGFISDVITQPTLTEAKIIRFLLTPHMDEVRALSLAIPGDSEVFTTPWHETNNPIGTWLRRYFNTTIPLHVSTTASETQGRIRDLWLKPALADRLSAMQRLASEREAVMGMSTGVRPLMRMCAWNTAAAAGLPADVTLAATKLTCWAYGDFNEGEQGPHAIANAVIVLMARSQHGANAYENMMSTAKAKSVLIEHPLACIYLLQWIQAVVHFRERKLLHPSTGGSSKIDDLHTWLPGCDSAISMGSELGLSYEQILSLAAETLDAAPGIDLPEDVSQGISI